MDIRAPSDVFREIFFAVSEVEDTTSAEAAFFKAGRRLGPRLASTMDELAARVKELGWGELTVTRTKDVYSATLRGTLFPGFEAERGVCSFYSGLLSGVAEKQDKRRTVFVERRCVNTGAKECAFESIGAGE